MSQALDLERIFTYHAPFGDQAERYGELRHLAKVYAQELSTPDRNRDQMTEAHNSYVRSLRALTPVSPELDEACRAAVEALQMAIDSLEMRNRIIRKVQSASMFANAAIAINEKSPEPQCLVNFGE